MTARALAREPGVGPTRELSLRVSVAALARVLFLNPENSERLLLLERRATRRGDGGRMEITVKSQPFGGALRIYDPVPLQELIAEFHFDSEESRREQDFRMYIRPSTWDALRSFCLEEFRRTAGSVLECSPERELAEEFFDALGIGLQPAQFTSRAVGTILEDDPLPTENILARGWPTARVYRIFEVWLTDADLARRLVTRAAETSDRDLAKLASRGAAGKANGVLALPLDQLQAFYAAIPSAARGKPVLFQGHELDETVAAVLGSPGAPRYRQIPDSP